MTAFLILHYKSTNQTVECIDSILKLENSENTRIMIVDNASNNGSFEELKLRYGNNKQISLLKLTESRGFSYGNNVGYLSIADKEDINYLIVCNNDTVFTQTNFLSLIEKCYHQERFDVLGPNIYKLVDSRKIKTSPKPKINISKKDINRMSLIHSKRLAYMSSTGLAAGVKSGEFNGGGGILKKIRSNYPSLYDFIWMQIIRAYCKMYFHISSFWDDFCLAVNKDKIPIRKNAYLQGACLIYSQEYFKKCDLPFEPETYFYYEELLLYLKAKKKKLKLIYSPKLEVWHKEGYATKKIGQNFEKTYFVEHNYYEAEKTVLKYMNE